ncbi:MAG: hypothetical protein KJO36_06075 [Acidimicrobiia bacterium]|nr:hypothetical protein [Acidimicrobiia bacterium]
MQFARERADELDRLRETNRRLNRRAQIAEAAARVTIEDCKRQGVSLGRVLANAGYLQLEDLCKRQREMLVCLDKLMPHKCLMCHSHRGHSKVCSLAKLIAEGE